MNVFRRHANLDFARLLFLCRHCSFTALLHLYPTHPRGRVSFWNGPRGALHVSLDSHRAGVLAVTASRDGSRVFAAGVDPTVARFERVPGAQSAAAAWVRTLRVQLHVRDVRVVSVWKTGSSRQVGLGKTRGDQGSELSDTMWRVVGWLLRGESV